MDTFVYVIWAGTILGTVLITLAAVKYPRRRILRIIGQSRPYSHRDLLQVNATIIAGLFILLTFQNITSGGISELIGFHDTMKEIEMYNDTRHNLNEDQAIRNEAEKRYVESTLDFKKYQIQFDTQSKSKAAIILLHPVSWLLISLSMFVFSSMALLASGNNQGKAFRVGEGFTISGFLSMGVALYIILVFAKF